MKKLIIVYLISRMKNTGPNRVLMGIVRHLDRSKFIPVIYTLSDGDSDGMKKEFEDLGIRVETFAKNRLVMWVSGKGTLLNMLEKEKPDVIHSHGLRADKVVADSSGELKKRGIASVSTIHCFFLEDYTLMLPSFIGVIISEKHIRILRGIETPVCCSQALSEKYQEKYGLLFEYVNNGIDVNRFIPLETYTERKYLREKLGLPEKKAILVVIGILEQRKNPLLIIKAFKKVKENQEAVLVFLGDGGLKETCLQEIGGSSNILLCGNVENVEDYLKCADVYISASSSEGLPNAMLEAGAAGLEMILSDIPQQTKIFEESKIEVQTFSCHDQENLTELMGKMIRQQHKTNKEMMRYINTYFSSANMSENYQKIYIRRKNQR